MINQSISNILPNLYDTNRNICIRYFKKISKQFKLKLKINNEKFIMQNIQKLI